MSPVSLICAVFCLISWHFYTCKSSSHMLFLPLPVHLPPPLPPPPLPSPSSSTSASHQYLSFLVLPPTSRALTLGCACGRVCVHACVRMSVCVSARVLLCGCVYMCVWAWMQVCVCLSHTDAALQGSLLKAAIVTEKKEELSLVKFSRTCKCVSVCCVCHIDGGDVCVRFDCRCGKL